MSIKLTSSRGFENVVTPFLKALSFLVDGFCQNVSLVKVGKLFEEISKIGEVPMEPGCGIWLTNLIQSGDIDMAF
ncbi:hypothetical protein NC651_007570 [Populus alba x Populus x berolinensis]|nr:hypothetical protein NC651_007570 [Populus alba x Populus x berolinensis]